MANDFSKGKVWKCIVSQAVPLTLAQLVQLLYNVVDRIYIGHLPGTDNMALTGVGLTFPVITMIAAFTSLFGTGGTPLFSIARGAKEEEKAEQILGNVFFCCWAARCSCFLFVTYSADRFYICLAPVMPLMHMQMSICGFICWELSFPWFQPG